MTNIPYVPATYLSAAFNCPLCGAFANQQWYTMLGLGIPHANYQQRFEDMNASYCTHCKGASFWVNGGLLHPRTRRAPPANTDMAADIIKDYEEAANIEQDSPKGAAALLRLCVQKLCIQLGEKGDNINEDIGALVGKGLPVEITQALDVVRVVGNNAVHPGQISIEENTETVSALFTLVNAVADRMITQPRQIQALHGELPPTIQDAIVRRNAKAALPAPSKP